MVYQELKSPLKKIDVMKLFNHPIFSLYLKSYLISSKDLNIFSDELKNQNQLKEFTFEIAYDCNQSQGMKKLGEAIKQLKNLKRLIIKLEGNNEINEQEFICFIKWIKQLEKLNILTIEVGKFNNIGAKGFTQIAEVLKPLSDLRVLNISLSVGIYIGANGIAQFSERLASCVNLQQLQLKFGNNNIIKSNGAISLGRAISKLNSLNSLSLYISINNEISNEGAIGISQGIQQLNNLKYLDLSIQIKNQIEKDGMISIYEGINHLKNLNELQIIINDAQFYPGEDNDFDESHNYFSQLKSLVVTFEGDNECKKRVNLRLDKLIQNMKQLKQLKLIFDYLYYYKILNIETGFKLRNDLLELDLTFGSQTFTRSLESNIVLKIVKDLQYLQSLIRFKMTTFSSVSQNQLEIYQQITLLTNIKTLELQMIEYSDYLLNQFFEQLACLKELNHLKLNMIKSKIKIQTFNTFINSLNSMNNIQSVNLNLKVELFDNQQNNDFLFQIKNSFYKLKNIISLILPFIMRDDYLYKFPIQFFRKNKRLILLQYQDELLNQSFI